MRRRLPALLVLAICLAGPVSGDVVVSHPVPTFNATNHTGVYDATRRRFLVFGTSQEPNEVWVLDTTPHAGWRRVIPVGTPPSSFSGAPAVYDSLGDRAILLADGAMWTLDLGGGLMWHSVVPSGVAPVTTDAMVVLDTKRHRLIGHGGFTSVATTNATWTLSLGPSPAWSVLEAAGGAPPERAEGTEFYDAASDRMLIFGGFTWTNFQKVPRNDLYALDLSSGIPTWNPMPSLGTPPSPRCSADAVLDAPRGRLVIVGGGPSGGDAFSSHRDAFTYDLASAAWAPLPQGCPTFGAPIGSVTGFDPVGQRMILAGSTGEPGGNPWELRLDLPTAAWTRIPATGSDPASVIFAGYDSATACFLGLANGAPWFLFTLRDEGWTPTLVSGRAPVSPTLRFYDPGARLLYVAVADSLFRIHPGDSSWTSMVVASPFHDDVRPATTFFDARTGSFYVFGTWEPDPSAWVLHIDGTPAWSKLASSTPIGIRNTNPILDTARNRLLFFGGALDQGTFPTVANDLWSLDLATLEWRSFSAVGTPPSERYAFGAGYDPVRDRAIVYGGMGNRYGADGVYYLEFGPNGADGAWGRNDPDGFSVAEPRFGPGAFDPVFDRFAFPASAFKWFELQWSPASPVVEVECPTASTGTSGSIASLEFHVTQMVNAPESYSWRLESRRAWPGFPLQGSQNFAASGEVVVPIGVPIPDTAAAGSDTLTFVVTHWFNGAIGDSCTTALVSVRAPGSPARLSVASNVVHGEFAIAFVAAHAGAGRIEAFDLRGRRVAARDWWADAAGPRAATLAEAGSLPPGAYFIRLSQGAERVSARVLLLGSR